MEAKSSFGVYIKRVIILSKIQPSAKQAGNVIIQAATMRLAISQCTADILRVAPTPMMAVFIV